LAEKWVKTTEHEGLYFEYWITFILYVLANKSVHFESDIIYRTPSVCDGCMDGSEKMPLLLIRKTEKPRCSKHMKALPGTYRQNSSAWITCPLFMEFLTCLENIMAVKNRKILLLLHQCVSLLP
jgi:hypothetical protein